MLAVIYVKTQSPPLEMDESTTQVSPRNVTDAPNDGFSVCYDFCHTTRLI